MTIQQGDQYAIPIRIKAGDTVVTPDNCTDVRVKIGCKLINYDGGHGELRYDPAETVWSFPLTEELSSHYAHLEPVQIGVKFNDDYIYSPVQNITIGNSIIKEPWDES